MRAILEAIQSGASGEEIGALAIPESYRGAVVRRDEQTMFEGLASTDKDPRKSLHIDEVPTPELAPDEVYLAVMASSINFNTVWTSIFEPMPTFGFLDRLGKESTWGKRHAQPFHVVGSDAAGVVLRTGSAVRNWKPGDRVVVHCNYVDDQDPSSHDDAMLGANQRIWGFESNYGGLAELSVVKANQLMPKPAHLSWEEAACNALCNSTSYRMLVSRNGATMKQGDVVFVWGASGGLGGYAIQYVLNGGGIPVGVVSSPEKVELLHELGCEAVIDRKAAGYRFWSDEHTQDEREWRRLGKDVRGLVGEDPNIVFEHPGRQTMGASVFVCARGGTVVTCAATSGYMIEYDNRHLWMKLKTIKSSHFANYKEAWEANRLIAKGMIQPILSAVHPLTEVGEAAYQVHKNLHEGKIGVLCLAPEEGLGIDDPEFRAKVGEDRALADEGRHRFAEVVGLHEGGVPHRHVVEAGGHRPAIAGAEDLLGPLHRQR
jgi:crotonyl-CoA reductase